MGHGAKILSSFLCCLFRLTAAMYVDDTNFLHWPKLSSTNPDDLIAHVQNATTDYG